MRDEPTEPGTGEPIGVPEAEELVDWLPVLAEVHPIDPLPGVTSLPAIQAAAAAMTGFVAGAATLAMMRRRHARRLARRTPAFEVLPMAGTRTYIVRVQRIGRLEE